jgi:DNA-binding IscR family transcriptional regulator
MLEVVEAVQGPIWLNPCVDPGQPCTRQGWCGAHRLWVEAQAAVAKVLGGATLIELAAESAVLKGDTEPRICPLGEEPRWS